MKVKNIMFAGFASAILSGVCGAASAADYNLVTQGYVTEKLAGKADVDASYTKAEADNLLKDKADASYVGTIPEGANVENVVAYVEKKTSGIASEGAMDILSGRVDSVEGDIDTLQEAMTGEGEGSVAKKIATAIAAEELRADGAYQPAGSYVTTQDLTNAGYATTGEMETALQGKQDVIEDLATIEANAAKGATAVQPGANVSVLVNDSGFQTAENVNTLIGQAQIAESQVTGLTDALAGKQAAGDYLEAMENAGTYLVKRDGEGNISYVSVEIVGETAAE